eukprot:1159614-Pelagomonas_calceolata.AAC.4
MKGGLNLEVRKENAVKVSTTLAVSVSDFYDNLQGKFLQSLAFAMGIPLSRFQVCALQYLCHSPAECAGLDVAVCASGCWPHSVAASAAGTLGTLLSKQIFSNMWRAQIPFTGHFTANPWNMWHAQIVSVVPGSTVVDARAYDDPNSYGPSKDPSLGSPNMTAGLDADDPIIPNNITAPANQSDFASALGNFVKSIQTGDFEAALGVKMKIQERKHGSFLRKHCTLRCTPALKHRHSNI